MATKTVSEWAAEIQKSDGGLVVSPQVGNVAQMAPAGRLSWVLQVLAELGLDGSFLAPAQALAQKARDLRTEAVVASTQAAARRASAMNTLGQNATLASAVELWAAQGPWLDTQPDHQRPPALEIAEHGARLIESGITAHVFSHGERIFSLAAKRAAELVEEVSALSAMPRQLWQVADPANELARWREHRTTYGTLVSTHHDFWLAHALADVVRDSVGAGVPHFADGAPRTALWLKSWRKELNDDIFSRLKPVLRIRYAVDHDFGPGLWKPSDVQQTTATERTFGSKLGRLGIAVGVPQSFPHS